MGAGDSSRGVDALKRPFSFTHTLSPSLTITHPNTHTSLPQHRRLKREYAIDSLPDISARPELLNLLHPKVQQMCRQFPVQVREGR